MKPITQFRTLIISHGTPDTWQYWSPVLAWVVKALSSLQHFRPKLCINFSSGPRILHSPPIVSRLYFHPNTIWWKTYIIKLHITQCISYFFLFVYYLQYRKNSNCHVSWTKIIYILICYSTFDGGTKSLNSKLLVILWVWVSLHLEETCIFLYL